MKTDTQNLFAAAGWFPGRAVDTAAYESALRSDGYGVPGCVRDFLREFGGLKVVFPSPKMPQVPTDVVCDPLAAMRVIYRERVQEYEERLGVGLTVIGLMDCGHLTLMMDAAGHVFGGADDYLVLVGRNGKDALDAIIGDEPFSNVP